MKVRRFPGATITDMYDHLKPILKRHPEFLILHLGTNDASKYTPNEIIDKVLALKRFVAILNEKRKVVISALTMHVDSSKNGNAVWKVNEILKELNIPLSKNFNIVRKHLVNRGLHLNEHGRSRLIMNYIAAIRKLGNNVGYPKCDFDLKPMESTETFKIIESNCGEGLLEILKNIRIKNVNRVLTGHININSISSKFDILSSMVRITSTS